MGFSSVFFNSAAGGSTDIPHLSQHHPKSVQCFNPGQELPCHSYNGAPQLDGGFLIRLSSVLHR